MSVEQLESKIRELSPEERRQFADWFDDHREELVDDDFELSDEQKAEILRRRSEALAHPELLVPWKTSMKRVRARLNEIRRQKT